MRLSASAFGLLAAGLVPAAAQPVGQTGRLCSLPQVVRTLELELERQGTAGVLDARNPGEVSAPDGSGSSCAAWLTRRMTNTNLPTGQQEQTTLVVQNYRVRRMPHSLVVELAD